MAHDWTEADLTSYLAKRSLKRVQTANKAYDAAFVANTAKPSKYRSQKTECDGYVFDSRKEAARYVELRLLEKVGAIRDLARQVTLDCYGANGERVSTYRADFAYWSLELGKQVYEDAKGYQNPKDPVTRLFRLKKKLLRAQGIEITEV